MTLKPIQSSVAPQAIGPYVHAVQAGSFLYTSGQIPLDKDGQFIEGGIDKQTHQVFKNLQAVLDEAGLTLRDVVKATVFVKDMNQFAAVNEVYAQYFNEHKPARSTVEVARLPKDALVEIEFIAYISELK